MNKGHNVISYQPEPSDLHQIIHELANVMQRCLARIRENIRAFNAEQTS